MSAKFRKELATLLKARLPLLYIESFEERRVLREIRAVTGPDGGLPSARPVLTWSATEGLVDAEGQTIGNTSDPARAVEWICGHEEPAVFVLRDFHAYLGDDQRAADAELVRRLRDVSAAFQFGSAARSLIIVAPVVRLPPELEKEIYLVDFALPGQPEIARILDNIIASNQAHGRIEFDVDADTRELLVQAALGLTEHEAESAYALAMAADARLDASDVSVVLEEKRQTVRKSGILEFLPADLDLADVGGLDELKSWLGRRAGSWLTEAAAFGVPAPKGALITGVPGCGKSLTAKAVAAAWSLPLLRMDIGRVFAGLVGSSEQNMRAAIRSAEAAAPCVLWIDEIEKGFSGVAGGTGDSGTASRVFGTFLTWMQEKTSPVFVMATANNVRSLPPEFLRKGRFDEIFFVDLPVEVERAEIWELQLRRHVSQAEAHAEFTVTPPILAELARRTADYSGAEIEQIVIAALFDAFAERRAVTEADLFAAIDSTVPLSVTQAEAIAALRDWASGRATPATSRIENDVARVSPPPPADRPSPGVAPDTHRLIDL